MMTDIPTLITGPSGTGKELVARAIGLSRYVPFDTESRSFVADYGEAFQPVHLAAMTPALIESELFGHCKGSFTGAVRDRAGRLEECPSCGSVFMDEVGEISMDIQVKLLRVLQSREFQRVGESQTRIFSGRIITATNRDLAAEATAGRFREDLYYRLCADTVTTPSLRDQLDDCPQDLTNLISFIAGRIAGDESESVTAEATAWIQQSLDPAYPWPGNIRELEQCVRNIMVHGEYRPAFAATRPGNSHEAITAGVDACSMTADELVQHYCSLLYARTGSYEKAAVVLQLDRRTVKAKVDKCRSAFGFDD
jgi:DNA-binding NtrC family response regulator